MGIVSVVSAIDVHGVLALTNVSAAETAESSVSIIYMRPVADAHPF
jgi:hypothetical protein